MKLYFEISYYLRVNFSLDFINLKFIVMFRKYREFILYFLKNFDRGLVSWFSG